MNPERLALIREALDSDKHPLITMDAADVRALLDAAAERDSLRAKVEEAPLNRFTRAAGATDGPTPTRVPGEGREGVNGKLVLP